MLVFRVIFIASKIKEQEPDILALKVQLQKGTFYTILAEVESNLRVEKNGIARI